MKNLALLLLVLAAPTLTTSAFAASDTSIEHRFLSHGVSEFTYTEEVQTCANFQIGIGVESARISHRDRLGARRGKIEITVGDFDALHNCHFPGGFEPRSVKFALQNGGLRDFSGLFALSHAVDYDIVVNEQHMGILQIGLVGEHQFNPTR